MRTYTLQPHQKRILEEVKRMKTERLYYVVVQQSINNPVFTLNELKKHIRGTINHYIKNLHGLKYKTGMENEAVQYYCFFETSKDFFWSQHSDLFKNNVEVIFHFHLFINGAGAVHVPQLITNLFLSLTSQKNKQFAVSKFDYIKINKLEDDFILYHTKQQMYSYAPELLMKNVSQKYLL